MKNFTGEQSGIQIIAQRILQGQYSQFEGLPATQEGRSPQPQARGKQFPYNHEANPLQPRTAKRWHMGRASRKRRERVTTKEFFFRFITPQGVEGIFGTEAQSPDQALQKFLKFLATAGIEPQPDNGSNQKVKGGLR